MSGIPATYSRAACREIDIACIVRLSLSGALTDAELVHWGPRIFEYQCEQLRKDVEQLQATFLIPLSGRQARIAELVEALRTVRGNCKYRNRAVIDAALAAWKESQ